MTPSDRKDGCGKRHVEPEHPQKRKKLPRKVYERALADLQVEPLDAVLVTEPAGHVLQHQRQVVTVAVQPQGGADVHQARAMAVRLEPTADPAGEIRRQQIIHRPVGDRERRRRRPRRAPDRAPSAVAGACWRRRAAHPSARRLDGIRTRLLRCKAPQAVAPQQAGIAMGHQHDDDPKPDGIKAELHDHREENGNGDYNKTHGIHKETA